LISGESGRTDDAPFKEVLTELVNPVEYSHVDVCASVSFKLKLISWSWFVLFVSVCVASTFDVALTIAVFNAHDLHFLADEAV